MGTWLRGLLGADTSGRIDRTLSGATRSLRLCFRRGSVRIGGGALAIFLVAAGVAQATTTYVYDANGRLSAVTNSTGASAQYVYDAMGNLLHVDSVPAGTLKIFAFSPDHGAVGTAVTIKGQGFSATPADDAVEFNGTAATVTAATTTTLTTRVPTGATTGKLSVTVGSQSATSDDDFTVDNTGQAPVITSFSPAIGPIGTQVTVTGEHFEPVPNQTTPAINGWPASPTSVTDTQVQFAVSPVMGSGKVSITTPYGQGVSSADFYVLPPNSCGNSAANVTTKKHIAVGESTGAMTIPAGDCAAILFDAGAGSFLSFQASNITGSVGYKLFDGHNHLIGSGTLSTSNASIHLPAMLVTGTYSIWLSSSAASDLALTLQADQTLPLNSALTTSTTGPGQTQRLFFTASAQETLGLQLANQTTSPSGASVQYSIYAPNGSQVTSFSPTGQTFANLPNLPATGTYTLVVTPTKPATTTSQLELVSGVAAHVMADGSSLNLSTMWSGQRVYLNFTATAGEDIGIGLSNISTTAGYVQIDVYSSGGEFIKDTDCWTSNGPSCGLDLQHLAAGNYQITIVPGSYTTMSFTATFSQDAAGTLPMNTPETVDLSRYGQTGTYTFTTTQAGETVGLEIGAPTTVPSGKGVEYTIYAPNGSTYTSAVNVTKGTTWNLPNLAQVGTYSVYVQPDPTYGATLSESMELVSGVTGTPAISGPPEDYATTVPGQRVYLNFTATAGEDIGIGLSNISTTAGYVQIDVYSSGGEFIKDTDCWTSNGPSCGLDLQHLAAGNYQITIVPGSYTTMSFTATLSQDAAGTLPMNTPETVDLSRYGQTGTYTFTTTQAGETVGLEIGAPTTVPSGKGVEYTIYAPNGSTYTSAVNVTKGTTWNLPNLAQVGTYSVYVQPDPTYGATLSESMELVSGVTGTPAISGPPEDYATTVPGQRVYLNFTATAGEDIGIGLSNISTTAGYVQIDVYSSGGEFIKDTDCWTSNGPSCGLDLQHLAAGNYQITIVPGSYTTMSFTATLSQDAAGTLPMNTPETVDLSRYGQTGTYTFTTTQAGETVGLEIGAPTTVPSGKGVEYTIYAPNGSTYTSAVNVTKGTTWNLPNLAQVGTYSVYVQPDPTYGATLSESMELVSGVTGTPAISGPPEDYATTVPGQRVYLNFTATAGEDIGIGLSNISTTAGYVQIDVYSSGGEFIKDTDCWTSNGPSCGLDLQHLAAGNYQITIVPGSYTTMSFTATFSQDAAGTLPMNTPETVDLSRYGQTGTYTFTTTQAGETVGLEIGAPTTVPSGKGVEYTIYAPNGSTYTSAVNVTKGTTWNLPNLAQVGTYSVYVQPDPTYGATLSESMELVSGVTGTLPVNGDSQSFATTVPGENVYLDFATTATESLTLELSNISTSASYVQVYVYSNSGQQFYGSDCYLSSGPSCSADLQNLPAGNYQITVRPGAYTTMSFTVALTSP